jgi:phosphomevalonate kinase
MPKICAPGKLFVFGEYAVLGGAWAFVVAVDRWVSLRRTAEKDYRVVGAAFEGDSLLSSIVAESPECSSTSWNGVEIDVSSFYESEEKLGLGSSAASCVALTAAALGTDDVSEIFEIAFAAHRRFQGGRGSGADIAASCFGGAVAFRLKQQEGEFPLWEPKAGIEFDGFPDGQEYASPRAFLHKGGLPHGVRIVAVWLGRPAYSSSMTAGVEQALQDGRPGVTSTLRALGDLSASALVSIASGDQIRFVEDIQKADRLLEDLGTYSGVPIIVDGHRRLREHVAQFDLVAKPSGAGGGDFSLVVGAESADWTECLSSLPGDLRPMEFVFGVPGVVPGV